MLGVVASSWALFLGVGLLLVGNSLFGSVIGLRGGAEGFDPGLMGFVMSAYFVGFLGGSLITPKMLRRVGHVRVFAALASLISAAFILCASFVDPFAWIVLRLVVGFCYSGVYVVAESWLNDASSNENRGQMLSAYLVTQMAGVVTGTALLNVASPTDYDIYILMSVIVSLSFAPILLSVAPAPEFTSAKPLSIRNLYEASPLGCVGMFLLGMVFSAFFGMSAVFASLIGLSVAQTSLMIGALYVGGLVCQFPIGWLSDRMDRRQLIAIVTVVGAATGIVAATVASSLTMLIVVMMILGGMVNPLYGLLIAYTNDFLEQDKMAAASGGLIFLNGVGAMGGPLLVGYLMKIIGPQAFFLFIGWTLALICGYALYRMTQRAAPEVGDTAPYAPLYGRSTMVAAELAADYVAEAQDAADAELEESR